MAPKAEREQMRKGQIVHYVKFFCFLLIYNHTNFRADLAADQSVDLKFAMVRLCYGDVFNVRLFFRFVTFISLTFL